MFRSLTPEQRALITTYAELDKDVNGSVEGIVNTDKGTASLSQRCSH